MFHKSVAILILGALLCCGFITVGAQEKAAPASQPSQRGAKETVNLMDLELKTAKTYLAALKPGQTVRNKIPSLGGKPLTNAFASLGYCISSYQLKGKAERLTGMVGIDDSVAKTFTESAEFIVYGDNKKLWTSGPLKAGGAPVSVEVDLRGVQLLALEADFAGDQVENAQVTWSDMAISYSGFRPLPVYTGNTPFQGEVFMTPKGPDTPRITGGRVFGVRPGSPLLFTVTASGQKPMTFAAKNLPQGLLLNTETGQITGCLQKEGEHRVALSARNALGTAEREVKIVVGKQLSLSPPMGWSSWNVFLKEVDQAKVEKTAELMVSLGLKDHGYLYVNIDDGWQGQRGGEDNALQPNEKFPDMKGLCDKIHKLGLKAGIYSTPWITSYGRYPGSGASNPEGKWSREKDGKSFKVGPYLFLNQDAKQWGKWGFDSCKWDWHFHKPGEIIAVSQALKQSGRDMLCGLSNRAVIEHGQTYVEYANSWRTTNDLLSNWVFLSTIAFTQDQWAQFGGPGHWLDLDSLISGFAWGRPTNLNPDEQYLQMSMWALMSAPLWMSTDFEKINEFTLRLLTNDEVLDIDQDPLGKPARRKWRQGHLEAWVKDMEDGSKAVGFFNRGRDPLKATIEFKDLGLGEKYRVRDLWKRADLGSVEGKITVTPAPHGVQLYKMTRVLTGAIRSEAGVEFSTSNPVLQRVFDGIVRANRKNEDCMEDGKRVLVEGDIWRGIWLETQPMGGSMYGKFNLEIARNNFDVVLDGQYENGKLPHLTRLKGPQMRHQAIGFNAVAQYGLDLYYLLNEDVAFLCKLEKALTLYEAYLWQTRDPNGNGVLQAYCTSDTGEDGQAKNRYDLGRERDKGKNPRFVDSVSVTADSYANRAVLAQIAAIQGDEAKRLAWQAKADALQKRAKEYFWVEERKAAFDRSSKGETLPALNQLNIRAMAQGMFTQQMADDFVRCHLMNPQEFFTPYPIPSTAINSPTFLNVEKSTEYCSWAGPSMGLTLQRSVKALENYGHYVEIGLIGEKLLNRIGQEPVRFPVQFNPLTGDAVGRAGGYGPMILASMEFLSRMVGVYVYRDSLVWNGLPEGNLEYKQTWQQHEYRLVNRDGRVSGFLNGNKLFEVPAGLRVETDYQGNVKKIAGIAARKVSGPLHLGKTELAEFAIDPNQVRAFPQTAELRRAK